MGKAIPKFTFEPPVLERVMKVSAVPADYDLLENFLSKINRLIARDNFCSFQVTETILGRFDWQRKRKYVVMSLSIQYEGHARGQFINNHYQTYDQALVKLNPIGEHNAYLLSRRLKHESYSRASQKSSQRVVSPTTIMFKPLPSCPVWIKLEWVQQAKLILFSMGCAVWDNPPRTMNKATVIAIHNASQILSQYKHLHAESMGVPH